MKKGHERIQTLDAENWKVHQKKTEKRVIPNIPRFTDIIKLHSFTFHKRICAESTYTYWHTSETYIPVYQRFFLANNVMTLHASEDHSILPEPDDDGISHQTSFLQSSARQTLCDLHSTLKRRVKYSPKFLCNLRKSTHEL